MLFNGNFLPGHEQLFERIVARKGEPLLLQAYMTWFFLSVSVGNGRTSGTGTKMFAGRIFFGRKNASALLPGGIFKTVCENCNRRQGRRKMRHRRSAGNKTAGAFFLLKGIYFPFYQSFVPNCSESICCLVKM